MGTNYFKQQKNKHLSFEDISKLIIEAIEQETFFNKNTLIPKVQAILKSFPGNLNATKYNRIESPSDAARRLRTIEQKEVESKFWLDIVKKIDPDNLNKYYQEQKELLKERGFSK